MPIILEGHNPQISKDWNGDGEIKIAVLNKGKPIQDPKPESMSMDSADYHNWHRENVVIPSLLRHYKKRLRNQSNQKDKEQS